MVEAMRRDPETDIVVCSRYADGRRMRHCGLVQQSAFFR